MFGILPGQQLNQVMPGQVDVASLMKALSAGHATDPATFTGGRALMPESLESVLVSALTFNKNDFKLLNIIRREPVKSVVHSYTRRKDVGGTPLGHSAISEGGSSLNSNQQSLDRITVPIKYLQDYRAVTHQMAIVQTLEDSQASEEEAGAMNLLKDAEYLCFHGDADVVPEHFNGALKMVDAANIIDNRGKKLTDAGYGDAKINESVRIPFQRGGDPNASFMPPIIAQDMQTLIQDRYRVGPNDKSGQVVVAEYPTVFGSKLKIANEAGPNKFFRIKEKINPTDSGFQGLPSAPTLALLHEAKASGELGFDAGSAGDYYYEVFAINAVGISAGVSAGVTGAASPVSGDHVKLTITDGATPGTGYILSRSKKGATGATDCREFKRVKRTGANTVVYDDNSYLPGTGEILNLDTNRQKNAIQFDQLLDLMKFPLFPSSAAVWPFLMLLYGALDIKIPWYHSLIINVGYTGLDWY